MQLKAVDTFLNASMLVWCTEFGGSVNISKLCAWIMPRDQFLGHTEIK